MKKKLVQKKCFSKLHFSKETLKFYTKFIASLAKLCFSAETQNKLKMSLNSKSNCTKETLLQNLTFQMKLSKVTNIG